VTNRGGTFAALLAALARPSWWVLALAGFLVRGGIAIFVLAIVTLPSPLALANVLEPIVTPLYLGRVAPVTLALVVTGVASLVAWLVLGSWLAAVTEVALIQDARQAALDEALPVGAPPAAGRRLASRAAAAHLVALIPAAFAFGIGSIQVVGVAYRELINPTDASPIVLRVVAGAAASLTAIVVLWVLGEIVGGMAVRRIVIAGQPVLGAIAGAAADLVRRPAGGLVAPLATTALLAVDLAAALTVVTIVWSEVRTVLARPGDGPVAVGLALIGFGAAWCLALLVTGLIDAWRSTAMTFDAARRMAVAAGGPIVGSGGESRSGRSEGGTIGASTLRRPGDWSADDRGGSL